MNESESKNEKTKNIKLKKIATISTIPASTITIITGVLSWRDYIPDVLFKLFLTLTILIILFLLVYFFVTLLHQRVLKKWREARKNNALVKKYFDDFELLCDRLGDLLKDNRIDNIPYVFTNLRNMPPEFYYPRSLIYDLANLIAVLKEGMKNVLRSDFRLLIKCFESILRIYNSQLVLQPFRQIRNLYRDKLTEYERDTYEKSRENYVRFLQDYMNFAKAINKGYGEKIAQDYSEQPGKLEKK